MDIIFPLFFLLSFLCLSFLCLFLVAFGPIIFLRAMKTDSTPPRRYRLGTQSRDPNLSSGANVETHQYVCYLRYEDSLDSLFQSGGLLY